MKISKIRPYRVWGVIFALLLVSARSHGQVDCQSDNPQLQSMPMIEVTLTRDDGSHYVMAAKLADNNVTRAAGFQHVCGKTIAQMPILFVFPTEVIPRFHMNNVVAPIDIAFIRKDGGVESIQSMKTYSLVSRERPLYSPKRPVLYALEVHKDFYKNNNISLSSKMSWTKPHS